MQKLRLAVTFICLATFGYALDETAFKSAVDLYTQHRPLEARQAFETLAVTNPDNADIQFYLGRLALQRDDPEKAATYLEKAVELAPNDSRMHLRLGDAYGRSAQKAGFFSKTGWALKSKAAYEKAVGLDPKNITARQSLLEFYRQAPGFAGGGMDLAYAEAAEIQKLDPVRGAIALATLYAGENKYSEAFAKYDEILKTSPDDYLVLYQSGRLAAVSSERLERGLTALRKCLTLTPPDDQPGHAAVHWRIGNILEKQGDKAGARAEYEASLKVDPNFRQASDALKKLD